MELTILLSKVIGLYLIIVGIVYLVRREYFINVVRSYMEQKMLRVFISTTEIIVGLFFVITHNVWDSLPEAIISLFGWIILLEGLAYVVLSDKLIGKIIRKCNTKRWYIFGGLISVLLGLYLANFGFNWF